MSGNGTKAANTKTSTAITEAFILSNYGKIEEIKVEESDSSLWHPCNYCKATYHSKKILREHLVGHHAELLFHCAVCDDFADRKHLISHMSQHAIQYVSAKTASDNNSASCLSQSVTTENTDMDQNKTLPIVDHVPDNTNGKDELEKKHLNYDAFSIDSNSNDGFGTLPDSIFTAIEEETADKKPRSSPATRNKKSNTYPIRKAKKSFSVPTVGASKADPLKGPRNKKLGSLTVTKEKKPSSSCNTSVKKSKSLLIDEDSNIKGENAKVKGIKIRACPKCSKQFNASSSYFYHIKYAHTDPTYSCIECDKKFVNKILLAEHSSVHTGNKNYTCRDCGKKFRTKSGIYIHIRNVHTENKDFVCDHCNQSFKWRQKLLTHLITHTKEKRYFCSHCNKGFGQRCDLTRHALTHTSAEQHPCLTCGKVFAQIRYLKVHVDKMH